MNFLSVTIFSLTALSVACVTREHNESAATQSQTLRNSDPVHGVSLRGTHNNWEAEPMLKQGYYSAADIFTFKSCEKVAFKFDIRGDWSENYGDADNVRGFNPGSNVMEGSLDKGASNIEVACGKTLYIEMNYGMGLYGFRELPIEVPQTLPVGVDALFRKALRGGGQYGAVNISGELLVREKSGETSINIRAIDSQNQRIVGKASLYKSLANGLQLWRFTVGSYGKIDLESIQYKNNNSSFEVKINSDLIQ